MSPSTGSTEMSSGKRTLSGRRPGLARTLANFAVPFICLLAAPTSVFAICNIIPKIIPVLASDLGSVSRPWAGPGETIEIETASSTLNPSEEWVVTINSGPDFSDITILSNDCADLSGCSDLDLVCGEQAPLISIVDRTAPDMSPVLRVEVRLPELTAGPARIVLRPLAEVAEACEEPSRNCLSLASADPAPTACIESIYARRESGGGVPGRRNPIFGSFTLLPASNDFGVLACEDPGRSVDCVPTVDELRLAVDRAGNLLIPITWTGVLEDEGFFTLPREVTANIRWPEAWPAGIPDAAFLRSFAPSGAALAPFFEPSPGRDNDDSTIVFHGLADAFHGIVRIAANHGTLCEHDAESGSVRNVAGLRWGGLPYELRPGARSSVSE